MTLPANNIELEMAAEIRVLQRKVERLESLEQAGCLALFGDSITPAGGTTFTFISIPQTHKHLWLLITAQADDAGGLTLEMTFNGDTGAKYDWERMENSTLIDATADTKIKLGGASTDEWIVHEVNIMDYAANNAGDKRAIWKGARTRGAPPCVECTIIQGGALFDELGTITSLSITSTADSFGDARVSLYGLC